MQIEEFTTADRGGFRCRVLPGQVVHTMRILKDGAGAESEVNLPGHPFPLVLSREALALELRKASPRVEPWERNPQPGDGNLWRQAVA